VGHARKQVAPLPPALGSAREADGVAYVVDAAAPGLKFFRCEAFRATLSVKGCATRWVEAQGGARARGAAANDAVDALYDARASLDRCRSCAIGAAHAGYTPIHYSPLFGASICPRCGRGTTRMIHGRRCISCYNREREMKAGRNARGNRPSELLQNPLRTVELRVAIDNTVRPIRDRDTTGAAETMVQLLRTTKGELGFGFAGSDRHLKQARLF